MKHRTLFFVSLITAGAMAAAAGQTQTPEPADLQKLLQDALFAEEATQDLPKAAATYEALLEAYAEQRRLAATALFRLAEVRRKQNRPQDAVAHYQQLLRDFPAEEPLARLSRENLLALGVEEDDLTAPPPNVVDDEESREIARLKELMAKSPDLLRGPMKVEGEVIALPPLHRAAAKGQLRVMAFLLENGFPVDGVDAVEATPLRFAADAGQKAACEWLLEHGADIDASNPLFAALKNGHLILAEYLLEAGADPDQFDVVPLEETNRLANGLILYGWRPLHWAIWTKNEAVFDLLLEHDADVNATLRAGVTSLHLAAHHDTDFLRILIDRGADAASATETTTLGDGPHNQPAETVIEGGVTALHFAVGRGNLENIEPLLASGAPIDTVTEVSQMTPLFLATEQVILTSWDGHAVIPETVRLLVEHGASPNIAASDGRTPLHNVCYLGRQELAMLLLENGAEIDAKMDSGYTPLMAAATRHRHVPAEFMIALVEKGASLDAVQNDGKSALELASRANRVPLMRRFRYPEWVKEGSIRLSFPQILYTHTLASQASEDGQPPSLADVLLGWTDVPEDKRSQIQAIGPQWSNLRIFRKKPDGTSTIEVQIEIGQFPPELEWGDVIDVTTNRWEEETEQGGQYHTVSWEIPRPVRTVLEAAQVRQVTIKMDGIEKQLTLRGRLHIYNPLTEEAPLLPLGPLIRLLGGDSGEFINAELVVHRRPEQGGGTIRTQLGWSEAEQLVLTDGDRIEVTPLPPAEKELSTPKDVRIFFSSPGLLFAGPFPRSSDAPTLLQFLAWQYAPVLPSGLRDQARDDLSRWFADPDALAEAVIQSPGMDPRAILPYPDWSKLVIRRPTGGGPDEIIPVDLEAAMRACNESMTEEEARAFDMPLQFGDTVELPVLEERPDEPWTGFDSAAICLFEKALACSITYQEKDGDFRGVKLRWIPAAYIPTSAGLIPIPKVFPEFGKVMAPLAWHLVLSESGPDYSVGEVRRGDSAVEAGQFAWLQDGDRVIAIASVVHHRPRMLAPTTPGQRRVVVPPRPLNEQ